MSNKSDTEVANLEKGIGHDHASTVAVPPKDRAARLHEFREDEGYIVDADVAPEPGVKVAKDGHTRLIPEPSDDPHDPLNWSWTRKHLILFTIAFTAFLPDYGSATGAITLLPQSEEWGMTPDEVNHSQAGNVFMLGSGGIFIVAASAYFGRLPVLFWFLVLATGTAAWCAAATGFKSFMAARILNGFFSTVSQSGGLMFIQDMFFFHERARKINIWASFIIMSPYLGPLLGAFMVNSKPWPTPFWVYTALTALGLILTVLFAQETYYDRTIPQSQQPPRGNHLTRLTGIAQWRSRHLRNTFGQACWRQVSVILKPTVFIACLYYMLTFAWAVGINTTLSIFLTPLYGFHLKQVGFFYFTPIVAVALGEITGHWLHDLLARHYIRSHGGHFEPEVRLRATFVSIPCVVAGLVLVGQCLENGWHYMATAVSWGLYVFGTMVMTVGLNSYCLDSYPEASGEVSAWLNFSRTLGGFIISYFQVTWANAEGTRVSFGVQGGICLAAFGLIIALMIWGKRLRLWAGPLNFATT
ncbi:hypothetical protein VTK73DRAFT_9680 [Phialemonium thermophilum]|uniref:Major facilitator superfamily (MFS) profile domain-containing protein n=1 Tax=Phialemonium thermophilum TaxID=223376 RepID=A0ABR3W151_9PEZI